MKYKITIINSNNVSDYWENIADGITYNDIEKWELDQLIEMSLKQNFSVIIKEYKEEE